MSTPLPAFVVMPEDGTLAVKTPLGVVTLVCDEGGTITFYVPPTVKIEQMGEKR